ncbi:MAG TPA: hypothetical protein VF438_03425 [Candidatus Paceibacterota bacterium]
MTSNINKKAAIAAAVIAIASATPAFAQVSLNAAVNGNATVGNTVTGAVNTPVKANVDSNASHGSGSSLANANANAQASTSLGQTVSGIVSSGQNKNASADIDAQIKTIKASDSNVSDVEANDDSVTVSYKVPGRVLGIFPAHVKVLVTTDASGKTVVRHPWYAKVDNDASLKSEFEARNWTVTSSNRADVVIAIQTALKAWLSSTANASATTTASASADGR